MPLLGPIYLGTILRNAGHEVEIYNEDIYKPDYSKLSADLVGISLLTSTANRGYEIAKFFPREKVILGGVHASLVPEEAIQYARQVVVGEAEEVILDIVNGKLTDKIVQGRPIVNLDSLPNPDFNLIKGFDTKRVIAPVSTSRGCPHDCSFCSVTKMFGRQYRFRSAKNIISELKERQTKQIFFCDDNFSANVKRTYELLRLMLENKIKDWACQVRCEVAKDAKLLSLMAEAGCRVVCVGFESVNQKTLENYKKNQTVQEIVNSIKAFHKKRIMVHGMFVLGSDDDNEKTIWETLRFAIKQKIDTIQMMILTPLPGTKVHNELVSQKRIFTRDWNLYDGQHIVFNPKLLTAEELQRTVFKAYKKFYSLSRSFSLLCRLRFRNAMFTAMGHHIVKKFLTRNNQLNWLKGN